MLRHLLLCFLVSVVWASLLTKIPSNKIPLKDVDGRIVNGQDAVVGQFPWQVALFFATDNNDRYLCGGGIVNEEWILTAGHCVEGAFLAEIYVGVVSFLVVPAILESRTFTLHENFNSTTLANDIGLVKLQNPLVFNDRVSAVALSSELLEAGVDITVSGWGTTYDGTENMSQFLIYITITTIENSQCREFYGEDVILDEMVCAWWTGNSIKSPCNGDSGGPVVKDADTDPALVALVSFISGAGCESGYPSGYTRIAPYVDWINANTARQ